MNSFKLSICLIFLGCLVSCQIPPSPSPALVQKLDSSTVLIEKGGGEMATVIFQIRDGFHIMANEGSEDHFLFTTLTMNAHDRFQFGRPEFPKPKDYQLSGANLQMEIFDNRLDVHIPVRAYKNSPSGKYTATGQLFYQACNHYKCFPPFELGFEMAIQVE